ncbi:hypothetical protein CONPUDRAFT_75937 [Coniophora puteana RWD-64-598 SS2]|uniref:Uncharacterized protein n=1 Tax=Coniophora puteana (strain RWD-64-598) TaxID=741705 RepID=A0A5M3MEX9_CONPW|nr:uncharacterized protein CONPUDRAFT_75937 [Coniophora puteana RWD-64-598 SS2]EIW77141.1 hypothetical protein CONPUDRAFT_75937 [Coniophora puteana RWD-64-598 SS2]
MYEHSLPSSSGYTPSSASSPSLPSYHGPVKKHVGGTPTPSQHAALNGGMTTLLNDPTLWTQYLATSGQINNATYMQVTALPSVPQLDPLRLSNEENACLRTERDILQGKYNIIKQLYDSLLTSKAQPALVAGPVSPPSFDELEFCKKYENIKFYTKGKVSMKQLWREWATAMNGPSCPLKWKQTPHNMATDFITRIEVQFLWAGICLGHWKLNRLCSVNLLGFKTNHLDNNGCFKISSEDGVKKEEENLEGILESKKRKAENIGDGDNASASPPAPKYAKARREPALSKDGTDNDTDTLNMNASATKPSLSQPHLSSLARQTRSKSAPLKETHTASLQALHPSSQHDYNKNIGGAKEAMKAAEARRKEGLETKERDSNPSSKGKKPTPKPLLPVAVPTPIASPTPDTHSEQAEQALTPAPPTSTVSESKTPTKPTEIAETPASSASKAVSATEGIAFNVDFESYQPTKAKTGRTCAPFGGSSTQPRTKQKEPQKNFQATGVNSSYNMDTETLHGWVAVITYVLDGDLIKINQNRSDYPAVLDVAIPKYLLQRGSIYF